MLFRRKIYDKFLTWKKETGGKKALLVEGARRIGKSTVVEQFAKNEYRSYILIDFARATKTVKEYFLEHLNDLDTFFMLLSVEYGVTLYPRESIIVFDEVQMFPKAREAIKYLVADGRYDYIERILSFHPRSGISRCIRWTSRNFAGLCRKSRW